jgi:iron complex transport system substrate-binding protein
MAATRRQFLGGLTGGVALFGLAACGSGGSPPAPAGARSSPPFAWTDARGRRIDLAHRPTRLVAQSSVAATLLDLGIGVRGVYGELGTVGSHLSYQAGRLDLAKLTVLGKTYGQFDVEKYAALRPGLLIDLSFDDKTLWYVPQNTVTQVEAIAPTLAVKMPGLELPQIIDEFLRLAGRLGADLDAAPIRTARSTYDAAVTAVRTAAAAKPGLRVVALSRRGPYFADAAQHPDLAQLESLGVHFPTLNAKPGEYFVQISWEQIDRYPADVIIYDARETPDVAAAAARIATWNRLPAVRAGQVYPWYPAAPYSYRAYGPLYQDVARWLGAARILDQT